eukprot:5800237-Alexandrium_andersonii.AAC.1
MARECADCADWRIADWSSRSRELSTSDPLKPCLCRRARDLHEKRRRADPSGASGAHGQGSRGLRIGAHEVASSRPQTLSSPAF